MKSQEAVSQTEETNAKVLRQEGSQRGWTKSTKRKTEDARYQNV